MIPLGAMTMIGTSWASFTRKEKYVGNVYFDAFSFNFLVTTADDAQVPLVISVVCKVCSLRAVFGYHSWTPRRSAVGKPVGRLAG